MRYSEIFTKFLALFPHYIDNVTRWAPATPNAIRIKCEDGSDLFFTYTSDMCWTLECGLGYHTRRG